MAVVQNCADNLESHVRSFLTLVILEGRGLQTGLKKDYHEIIYEIYSCAPQMLLDVLPYLKEELVVCTISRLCVIERQESLVL